MKKNVVLTSILSLVLCVGLIAGGTFALFTDNSETGIAVTSGTVKVDATIGTPKLYTPSIISSDGTIPEEATNTAVDTTFGNGGTAEIKDNRLTLTNITPGDKVEVPIALSNTSNVTIQYRLVIKCETPEGGNDADSALLYSALEFYVNNENLSGVDSYITDWAPLNAGEDIEDLAVEILFPGSVNNDYQGLSTAVSFAVEAVQGNAETTNLLAPEDLKGETAQALNGKVEVSALNATLSAETSSLTIGDNNLVSSGVTELVINGGTIDSHIKTNPNPSNTDWPHVYSETNGAVIYVAAPAGSKVVFKNMTINGFYNILPAANAWNIDVTFENCTLNGCWVGKTNGLVNIKFSGCHFTLDGIENLETIKNTNPLWIGPGVNGESTLSLDKCVIDGNRPIKYSDDQGDQNGAVGTLSVTNCEFNLTPSAYDINANRLDRLTAIRFTDNIIIGEISGNTMTGGYAFYQTNNAPYSNADFVDTNNNKKPEDAEWTVEY